MIKVTRSKIYHTINENLCFIESFPVTLQPIHVCDCTQCINTQPVEKPIHTQQYFTYEKSTPKYNIKASLLDLRLVFTWHTPNTNLQKEIYAIPENTGWFDSNKNPNSHAYFTLNNNSIRFEITLPGYQLVDCFMGNIYFGNNIDISKLMNGHSQSKIIQLDKIDPDSIWCHSCSLGNESMKTFNNDNEETQWWNLKNDLLILKEWVDLFEFDKRPVEELQKHLSTISEIPNIIENQILFLTHIIENLTQTELFRCGDYTNNLSSEVS